MNRAEAFEALMRGEKVMHKSWDKIELNFSYVYYTCSIGKFINNFGDVIKDLSKLFYNYPDGWEIYKPEKKYYVRSTAYIMIWLKENGYIKGKYSWEHSIYPNFKYVMLDFCGEEVPINLEYKFLPEWIEEREDAE